MLKKILAMLLAFVMMLSLTACGGNKPTDNDAEPDDGKKQERVTEEPKETEEPEEPEEPERDKFDEFKQTATIEETILYDDKDIVITAKDLTYEYSGVTLNVQLENNRDEDLEFSSGSCNSVNGYTLSVGNLYCDVASGKKTNEEMYFSYNEMRLHGIYELAELGLQFTVADDDDFELSTDSIILKTSAFDSYTFNPKGFQDAVISDAAKGEFEYSVDFFDTKELYNSSGISLVSQTIVTTDDGQQLFLEFANDSSEPVVVSIDRMAENGLVLNSGCWTWRMLGPSTHRVFSMDLIEDQYREALGITEIVSFSFDVVLKNMDFDVIDEGERVNVNVSDSSAPFDKTGIEAYNNDGMCLAFKGFIEDPSDYRDDIHALFIVENSAGEERYVNVDYDSLSINGFMTDFTCYSRTLLDGEFAMLDIEITDELDIDDFSDITELEFKLEIRDEDYIQVSEPTVTVHF